MNLDDNHLRLIQDPANIHRRELFDPEGMTNPKRELQKLDSQMRGANFKYRSTSKVSMNDSEFDEKIH